MPLFCGDAAKKNPYFVMNEQMNECFILDMQVYKILELIYDKKNNIKWRGQTFGTWATMSSKV